MHSLEFKIEAIRQKAIEANPEIQGPHEFRGKECKFCGDDTSILRPIRLADVLLAIFTQRPENRTKFVVESSGQFLNTITHLLGPTWNLRADDLTLQSDDTISFIYDVLYGE